METALSAYNLLDPLVLRLLAIRTMTVPPKEAHSRTFLLYARR